MLNQQRCEYFIVANGFVFLIAELFRTKIWKNNFKFSKKNLNMLIKKAQMWNLSH